jgi:hypothetical protein
MSDDLYLVYYPRDNDTELEYNNKVIEHLRELNNNNAVLMMHNIPNMKLTLLFFKNENITFNKNDIKETIVLNLAPKSYNNTLKRKYKVIADDAGIKFIERMKELYPPMPSVLPRSPRSIPLNQPNSTYPMPPTIPVSGGYKSRRGRKSHRTQRKKMTRVQRKRRV